MLFFALLIFFANSKTCQEIYANENDFTLTLTDAFECIDSITIPIADIETVGTDVKAYLEAYAFKDILKNPPQPTEGSTYHEKHDMDAYMDDLTAGKCTPLDTNTQENFVTDSTNAKFYGFYRCATDLITRARDFHLSFSLLGTNSNNDINEFSNFYVYLPFNFVYDKDGNLYLKPISIKTSYQSDQWVIDNQNTIVESINGEIPEEFIKEFAHYTMGLKNKHAQFSRAKSEISLFTLSSYPLAKEYLEKTIIIKYAGSTEEYTTTFKIVYINAATLSQRAQNNLEQRRNAKGYVPPPLEWEDLFDDIYEENLRLKRDATLQPKFNYKDEAYCFVDDTNGVNTFVLTTFAPTGFEQEPTHSQFKNDVEGCIKEFDKNDYPIQIILPFNGGGYVALEQEIENLFAPSNDVNLIISVRESEDENGKEITEFLAKFAIGSSLADPNTCAPRETDPNTGLGEWYTTPKEVDYGNNIKGKITQPSIMPKQKFFDYKPTKPRKPTEIVVYTDAYCYSCCSVFTKGLKQRGSAILASFNGNPKDNDGAFEVGQSPTTVEDIKSILGEQSEMVKKGFGLGISYGATYKYNYAYDETIPREFIVDEVDVRTNIQSYSIENLGEFTAQTLKIVEEYKTKCNSTNDKLVNYPDTPQSTDPAVEHAHGGYKCGDNDRWTTNYINTYCDEGFKYDFDQKKCLENKCIIIPDEDNGDNDDGSKDNGDNDDGSDGNSPSGSSSILIFSIMMILFFLI